MNQQMEDVKALQQFAIYAEIESDGVDFYWSILDEIQSYETIYRCVIGDHSAHVGYLIQSTQQFLVMSDIPCANLSRAEFLEQTLRICAANGLEPSGYWNCERSDFWSAAPVM